MLLQSLWGLELVVAGVIVFPVLWTSGLEPPPPLTPASISFLTSSVLFAAPYFLVYPLAVVYTSPFEVSLGSLCSIPLTALIDRLVWRTTYPLTSICGMVVVGLSLVLHGLLERTQRK